MDNWEEGHLGLPSGDWAPKKGIQAEKDWTSEDEGRSKESKKKNYSDISNFTLPRVQFCGNYCTGNIADLSREDKQRIALLVKELSKTREELRERNARLKALSEENEGLKTSLGKLDKEVSCLQMTLGHNEENLKVLTRSFTAKENSLRQKNIDLQEAITEANKERSELQKKLDEERSQIENLSRVIYNISTDNKQINKKYESTKEKLRLAVETLRSLEGEFAQSRRRVTENRSCQTEPTREEAKPRNKKPERVPDSSDDDSIISELFFVPKQNNMKKPSYSSDDDFF